VNGEGKWFADVLLLQTHINFPRFLPIFPDFLERLSHLAPITRDHQMLKSPHSLDPLASWVTCVLLCTCYARRTRSSSESIRLQGRCSRRDATSLSYEVLGFLGSQGPLVFRGQDDRSWTMKHARLRRSKVRTRVQRQVLKYLTTRNRGIIKNIMESYE
jgi:hypothetical protein